MVYTKKHFKAIKYAKDIKPDGNDLNAWAVFKTLDIKGLRSPISEFSKASPIKTGMNRRTALDFAADLEENHVVQKM